MEITERLVSSQNYALVNINGKFNLLKKEIKRHLKADIWLVFLTMIWGTSFSLVKTALHDITPILFLAIRFWTGSLFMMPLLLFSKNRIRSDHIRYGAVLGIFMFLGMVMQTIGLKYTTASKSGFITALTVIFVPILVVLINKRLPKINSLYGVLLSVTGIYFLTNPLTDGINQGDVFTLIGSVCFAFQIIFIEKLVQKDTAFVMAFFMVVFTALFASVASVFLESAVIHVSKRLILSTLAVALFSTAIGFSIQTRWQPQTSATSAAVIFTMEPVFAFIFAAAFLSERLTWLGLTGGALILSGTLVAELRQ